MDAERKQVTVLFTDMVGFTTFSERAGEEAAYTLMRPRGIMPDWQESTKGEEIFRPGECRLKAGSLSFGRMTLDSGRLSCGFDSGTASDSTLKMRMLCTDPEDKQPSMYGAQLKLLPGKKIELIIEPMDQR